MPKENYTRIMEENKKMGIKELLTMYLGNEIKLMYKDLTYVVGVLKRNGDDFFVDNTKLNLDDIKGWDLTK